jgi:type IV pilus assembly protein PilW
VFGIVASDAEATPPACVTGPGKKAGTDILVVRRTQTVPTVGALVGTSIYVQASGCNAELQQHKDFAIGPGSGAGTFALHLRGCVNAAEVYEFQTRIYYVSDETIPTLRLITLSGTTTTNEPLVEGIEDMRIEYGQDTDAIGDGTPNTFRKCLSTEVPPCSTDPSAGANVPWANMMAVQVYLLARNVDILVGHTDTKTYTLGSDGAVGPFNDSYKRHVYSAVVRLMNPAGRREL